MALAPVLLCGVVAAGGALQAQDAHRPNAKADAVFHGGAILTMVGKEPAYVEALAVVGDRIAFTGGKADAMKLAGERTRLVDLGGKAMLRITTAARISRSA